MTLTLTLIVTLTLTPTPTPTPTPTLTPTLTLPALRADPDAVTVAIDDSEQPFQCRPLVTACRYASPLALDPTLIAAAVPVPASS